MFIRRFPIIAVLIVVAMILVGIVISNAGGIQASAPPSQPPPIHNHPTIHYTDGQPAISPHNDGTLLAITDVEQYVSTHQFPGGRVIPGANLQVMVLQQMTSKEASIQMRGEYIGLPDSAPVYYVVVKGPFDMTGILVATGPQGAQTFNEGEEAFDAQTGNLLVWGIRS